MCQCLRAKLMQTSRQRRCKCDYHAGCWVLGSQRPFTISYGLGEGGTQAVCSLIQCGKIIQRGKTNMPILNPTTSRLRMDLNQTQASQPSPVRQKWQTMPPALVELRGLERRCARHQTKILPSNNLLNKRYLP